MGKQFTVAKDYVAVRYSLGDPKNYNAGDTVVLTDADYAALPASLTATIKAGSVTTVADPVYPSDPLLEVSSVDGQTGNVDLSATYGPTARPMLAAFTPAQNPPQRVTLIGGQPDEAPTVTGCTLAADTVNVLHGVQSWQMQIAAAGTATLSVTANELKQATVAAINLAVYVPDVTKVTALTMQLFSDATPNNYFTISTPAATLSAMKNGWNFLRYYPSDASVAAGTPTWGLFHHCRVAVVTNAALNVSVQFLHANCPPKAQVLFIHDGGYLAFDQSPGYADLKALGVPVTWSIDCGLIGDATHITEARLAQVAAENGNSISFHGWAGATTQNMTAAQLQGETMQCIKWLARRGYSGRVWRSAWLQNEALNAHATDSLVLANPMYGASNVETIHSYPFKDPTSIQRTEIGGKTNAAYDTLFSTLQANHGLLVCYMHRVADDQNPDSTPTAEWSYFLSKLTAAVQAGWLEGVTFETLFTRNGGTFRRGLNGALVAEYADAAGAVVTKTLPA